MGNTRCIAAMGAHRLTKENMDAQKRVVEILREGEKTTRNLTSLEQTRNFAKQIAVSLRGGDVIALSGDLGSGKTTFVQFLANELGVRDTVTSPTFVLMKIYKTGSDAREHGIHTLCHIDAYRLRSGAELTAIGAEEYVGGDSVVTAIEWSERVESLLPSNAMYLSFRHA